MCQWPGTRTKVVLGLDMVGMNGRGAGGGGRGREGSRDEYFCRVLRRTFGTI